jgi:hypothetical protein
MPIEIRELVIKTEIKTVHENVDTKRTAYTTSVLKNKIVEAFRRMISKAHKREKYNR